MLLFSSLTHGQPLNESLAQAAARVGLDFGLATTSQLLVGEYGEAAKAQFNLLVSELELRFYSSQPNKGRFNYSGGEKLFEWGKTNGQSLRGHAFIWPSQSGWVNNLAVERNGILAVLKTHIDSVGGHFKGKAVEWNVVNELLRDEGSGGDNAFRVSIWSRAIGDDFADSAFVHAHRVDPQAKLYYNEYGADTVNSKSTAMWNLAAKWKRNGIPIDGIGLQCHLTSPVNQKAISDNIRRFGELGLRVSLSEVDIKKGTTEDWVKVMAACLENFNCTSFVTNGLDDTHSWLGKDCNCLLYSEPNQPKPAVQALIDLMSQADPEIVAKRKDFTRESAVSLLPVSRKIRLGKKNYSLTVGPVGSAFPGALGVDGLGRKKSNLP